MKKFAFFVLLSAVMIFLPAGYSRAGTVEFREEVKGYLLKLHSYGGADARRALEEIMGGEQPLVDVLISIMLEDENRVLRERAASWLGDTGDERALEPLLRVLSDREMTWAVTGAVSKFGEAAVEPLVAALDDREMRLGAVRALGRIGSPEASEAIMSLLDDEDAWIRMNAITALGSIGDARAVEPLTSFLSDEDRNFRSAAVAALGRIEDERVVELLIHALNDDYFHVRAGASRALGEIGDLRAVEPLIQVLKDVETTAVRERASEALYKLGRENPGVLANGLEHECGALRLVALRLMYFRESRERSAEILVEALKDEDESVREQAVRFLVWRGGKHVREGLLTLLQDESARVRNITAAVLGSKNYEEAVIPLISTLEDEDAAVRSSAAASLGRLKAKKAVAALILSLNDENPRVRSSAAEALGFIGDTRAVEEVIRILKEDENERVRAYAARSLGHIGDGRAVDVLIEALKEESCENRKNAVTALGKIGCLRAVDALSGVLKGDEYEQIRVYAVRSLGNIGGRKSSDVLISALDEDSYEIRKNAVISLGRMKYADAAEGLIKVLNEDENEEIRAYAINSLGTMGRKISHALTVSFDSGSLEAVKSAAEEFIKYKNSPVVENLARVLQDESEDIRARAAWALGGAGDIKAVEYLIPAGDDASERVRTSVSRAKRSIREARDFDMLLHLLQEPLPSFRKKSPLEYTREFESLQHSKFFKEIYDKTRVLFHGDIVYWFRTGEPESRHPRWASGEQLKIEDVKMDFVSFPGRNAVILENPKVIIAGTDVYRIGYAVQSESLAWEAVLGNIAFSELENELLTGIENDHGIRGKFPPPMYAAWQMRAYGEILRNYETSRRGLQSSLKKFARENGRYLTNDELRAMPLDFTNPLLEVPGMRLDFFLDPFGKRLEIERSRVLEPDSVAAVRDARKNAFFVNLKYRLRLFPFLYAPFWFIFQFAAFFLHRILAMMVILYRDRTYRRTVYYWLSAVIIPAAAIKIFHPGHIYVYAVYVLSWISMLLVLVFLLIMPMHLKGRVDRTGKQGNYTGKSFLRDVGIFLVVSIIFFVFVLLR